jgi:ubiquinone/menaquinone biosynthesis C-methylase UbiE
MNESNEISVKTRDIYQKQHERILGDNTALNRITNMYSENKFPMNEGWFKDKVCADIGCGNVGAFLVKLYNWGCKNSIAVDIDKEWIPSLTKAMLKNGIEEDWCETRSGSVLDIPIESNEIDFVSINGVLIHLLDTGEVIKGFNEGARICKKEGYLFTSYGPCKGLVQDAIMPALRKYYHSNKDFKNLIDRISVEDIYPIIDKVVKDSKEFTNQDLDGKFLKELFGTDFCVFLQNFIQAPSWLSNETTPMFVEEMYKANGFTDVVRLNSYVDRSDIRKYFSPLHYDRDYWFSKIMYGEGYIQYIGKKSR